MKFYDTINKYRKEDITLFVDMDGVLAEYDIGNFDYRSIRPLKSNIKRVKELQDLGVEVKVLTVCKTDSIIEEKKDWFRKYMDFFPLSHVVFLSKEDGKNKGISSKELKSIYLTENVDYNKTVVVIDDDNEIVKYLVKNNKEIIVFQSSSWID